MKAMEVQLCESDASVNMNQQDGKAHIKAFWCKSLKPNAGPNVVLEITENPLRGKVERHQHLTHKLYFG